jgi:hypothetical protein
MAIAYVDANGVTTPDNWTLMAGASKVAAVASLDDEATSYIRSGTTIQTYQTFTCAPPLTAADVITAIIIRARCRRGGTSDCTLRLGYSFTPQGGGTQTNESVAGAMNAGVNWADFSFTDSGLSVAWGSGMTFWIRNTQGRNLDCTTLYAEITYTPGATAAAGPMVNALRLKSKLRGLV